MASKYYDGGGKEVVDGEVALAADLNTINSAIDSGFQLVVTDISAAQSDAEDWANKAEDWAVEVEDTEVEVGQYSALHWAAKASADAADTAADVVSAETAKNKAEDWATEIEDTEVETGQYSALHHAAKASASATDTAADAISTNADASIAEEWAENPEDTAITGSPGQYSALHHATKAASDAVDTAADVVSSEAARDRAETAADTIPTIASGDSLKAVRINVGETAMEYIPVSSLIQLQSVAASSTGTYDLDASLYSVFMVKVSGSSVCTFTISNLSIGESIKILVSTDSGSSIVWPAIAWPSGTTPSQTPSSNVDIYIIDGISTSFGSTSDVLLGSRISADHK